MKAEKYKRVTVLPTGSVSVSNFAKAKNVSITYVYLKKDRYTKAKKKLDYNIVNFEGSNFVTPL